MIAFPELHQAETMEAPVVAALSAIASGFLLSVSWKLGAIAFIPCGLWFLHLACLGFLNSRLRSRWSRQFSRRAKWRQLRPLLANEPARFIVHIYYYGGFDVMPLCPAAILEYRDSGELVAVHPANESVPEVCKQLGVQMVSHPLPE